MANKKIGLITVNTTIEEDYNGDICLQTEIDINLNGKFSSSDINRIYREMGNQLWNTLNEQMKKYFQKQWEQN